MKNPSQTPTLRRRKATKKAAKTPAKEERQACATFEAFGKRDKGSQILQSSTEQRSAAQPSTEIMSTNKGTDQNNDRNEAGSCGRTTSRSVRRKKRYNKSISDLNDKPALLLTLISEARNLISALMTVMTTAYSAIRPTTS